jgi:hypothetical protein
LGSPAKESDKSCLTSTGECWDALWRLPDPATFVPPFPWMFLLCTLAFPGGLALVLASWSNFSVALLEFEVGTRNAITQAIHDYTQYFLHPASPELEVADPHPALAGANTGLLAAIVGVCAFCTLCGLFFVLNSFAVRCAIADKTSESFLKAFYSHNCLREVYFTLCHLLSLLVLFAALLLLAVLLTVSLAVRGCGSLSIPLALSLALSLAAGCWLLSGGPLTVSLAVRGCGSLSIPLALSRSLLAVGWPAAHPEMHDRSSPCLRRPPSPPRSAPRPTCSRTAPPFCPSRSSRACTTCCRT